MTMDTNKNLYTVIYAVVLVIISAVILALAATLLKDRQQRNVEIETKQLILRSVHLADKVAEAADKAVYIEQEYSKYIKDTTIKADNGDDLKMYICTINGKAIYIFYVEGPGLWGPIWGYISLESDMNTIYGAVFDHKGETPGLGAEIATPSFYNKFKGKQLFDQNRKFVSVQVVKGGADPSNRHQVDAISGGTVTSRAVEELLSNSLDRYIGFIKNNLNSAN